MRELNAGGYFGPQFAGEMIPTLDEAIETLPAGCFLNIEAKRKKLLSDGLEAGIAAAVRRHNLYDRVLVSSFNPAALWRIGRKDRRIPLGLLYEMGMPFLMDTGWPRTFLRLAALHPSWGMVDSGVGAGSARARPDRSTPGRSTSRKICNSSSTPGWMASSLTGRICWLRC